MNKNTENNNWQFHSDDHEAINAWFEEFRNNPIPSDEVIEKIGMEEINKIDAKVKEMLHWREIMYGKDSKKVDYRNGSLYFSNTNYPETEIRCSAMAKMNKYNESRFKKYKDKATIDDYTIEIQEKITEVTNTK